MPKAIVPESRIRAFLPTPHRIELHSAARDHTGVYRFLSNIIPTLFFAPGLQILLLLVSLRFLKRRPRAASALIMFAVVSLYFLSIRLVSDLLIGGIEASYPALAPEQATTADAIIVLGDFVHAPTATRPRLAVIEDTDRLRAGCLLFKAGKAPFVIVSGGPLAGGQANAARSLLEEWGVPEESILVEGRSANTHENAVFSREMLQARPVHRVLLVTSGFHMVRAAAIFRKEGFEVLPFPADLLTGWSRPDALALFVPGALTLYYNQLAIHEYVGLAFYKLRGWA